MHTRIIVTVYILLTNVASFVVFMFLVKGILHILPKGKVSVFSTDKWPKTANGLPSTAGTTATVAFIRREKLYIGHVGDSGIVLGYQNENENFWRAKQLTIDHKPESAGERTRIMNSGGKVVVKSGVPRVVWNRPRNASHCGPIRKRTLIDEIPFLAVARSLGDLWSYNSQRNEFVVSPDPDVSVIPINPSTFRCLIFGTDGLWNVISAQEAVNTVRSKEMINERLLGQRADSPHEVNQWTNPSKSLVEQALRTWSHKKMRADNTSVVTVILYPPGQVDHSTDGSNYEATNTLDSPPTFLQPISCGLEYTQVQAEIPPYDDGATYQEMALKYLPPEAYRNFNYYDDESDTDDNDESGDEHEAKPALSGDLQQNTDYSQPIASTSNWIWENNNDNSFATTVKDAADTNENNEENEDEDEEEEEDEEEQNVEGEERKQKGIVSIMNFQTYLNIEAEATNNATDSYINTFAESYNSILTASPDECIKATAGSPPSSSLSSNSNSNSNSNCQSVTPPNMHDILQEQHLYQQQCMSEEEGYSLTKLETRREQQTGKSHNRNAQLSTGTTSAIQTFKIFHESPLSPQQIGMYHTNTERFYHQHEQFIPEMVVKPLEFHSLLQQEREEEQQVAYERLQMEKKLHQEHENIAAYACLQTANGNITTAPLDEQSSVEEEYLEEESIMEEEEVLAVDNSCLKHDESVQIHEISSSSCDQPISEGKGNCSDMHLEDKEITEELEMLPNAISETITGADDPSEPVEIRAEVSVKAKKYSIITNSKNSIYLPATSPALSTIALTPFQPSFSRSKRNKSTAYLYNNVPNENLQRISNSKYNHSVYTPNGPSRNSKKNVCVTPSDMTPPTATSTPMIQRQLRSTTTPCANTISATHVIDYGKRTLRTRNSLSKDMKAKSSMVPGAFKTYPQNVVTRNFIRTTAANLLVGKPLLMNDLNVATCSRRSLATANIRPPLRSSIRTRREKANMTINGSLNQNKAHIPNDAHSQLNLRSRQTTPSSASSTSSSSLSSSNTSTVRSSAANAPVIKRASLTERRMHTRSTSSRGSQTPANFSKSTRTQSTGSNLAAPPPSPKLINAVAAVAAATRARSLLNAKHVAAANGTQSVVSSVFGKRTSLRRKVSTHAAVLPSNNTSASLSPLPSIHQTLRGRIVKKLKR